MERYKCRLCLKSFINGRALGGHMRSHMLSFSAKRDRYDEEEERPSPLSDDTESGELLPSSSSASSSSSSSEEEDEDDEGNAGDFYGLRENPKRSVRIADPEFAFAVVDPGSVLFQDGESETESSRINPTRRRSKRTRNLQGLEETAKKQRTSQLGIGPVTDSASDTTTTTEEEDLAFCLMLLSRDKWKQKNKTKAQVVEEEEESEGYKSSKNNNNKARGKYKCETCGKVFKSYQALGGHRASHKKNRVCRTEQQQQQRQRGGTEYEVGNVVSDKKIHECPICFRVFPSGQALGGHKRSHGIISLSQNRIDREAASVVTKQRFLDLNLPAPTEDDETTSQAEAEASVVFDEC